MLRIMEGRGGGGLLDFQGVTISKVFLLVFRFTVVPC